MQGVQFMSVKQKLYYDVCIFIFEAVNNLLRKEFKNNLQIVGSKCNRVIQVKDIVTQYRQTRRAQ